MNNKIHISVHRIQKILKFHINKKIRHDVYIYIASVVHIMSHELLEIAIERALEINKYQVSLNYLFDALYYYSDVNLSKDDTLTLCLLRHSNHNDYSHMHSVMNNRSSNSDLSFKNYITLIKKDIINNQLKTIGKTHKEKITISKEIKEIISQIVVRHIIKLCGLIEHYIKFSSEKTIKHATILMIYSIWMKSLNVSDHTISEFNSAVQLKVDNYKK